MVVPRTGRLPAQSTPDGRVMRSRRYELPRASPSADRQRSCAARRLVREVPRRARTRLAPLDVGRLRSESLWQTPHGATLPSCDNRQRPDRRGQPEWTSDTRTTTGYGQSGSNRPGLAALPRLRRIRAAGRDAVASRRGLHLASRSVLHGLRRRASRLGTGAGMSTSGGDGTESRAERMRQRGPGWHGASGAITHRGWHRGPARGRGRAIPMRRQRAILS